MIHTFDEWMGFARKARKEAQHYRRQSKVSSIDYWQGVYAFLSTIRHKDAKFYIAQARQALEAELERQANDA